MLVVETSRKENKKNSKNKIPYPFLSFQNHTAKIGMSFNLNGSKTSDSTELLVNEPENAGPSSIKIKVD